METKHTKGEWVLQYPTISDSVAEKNYFNILNADVEIWYSTRVNGMGNDRYEAQANAKLIAAAPELLEALIRVQKNIPFSSNESLMAQVNHVIKKATE